MTCRMLPPKRRLHVAAREGTARERSTGDTLRATGFGVKVGYWPCFRAPFLELALNKKRYAVWYGYAGYDEAKQAGTI